MANNWGAQVAGQFGQGLGQGLEIARGIQRRKEHEQDIKQQQTFRESMVEKQQQFQVEQSQQAEIRKQNNINDARAQKILQPFMPKWDDISRTWRVATKGEMDTMSSQNPGVKWAIDWNKKRYGWDFPTAPTPPPETEQQGATGRFPQTKPGGKMGFWETTLQGAEQAGSYLAAEPTKYVKRRQSEIAAQAQRQDYAKKPRGAGGTFKITDPFLGRDIQDMKTAGLPQSEIDAYIKEQGL